MNQSATNREILEARRAVEAAKWLGITLEEYLHRQKAKDQPEEGHLRLGYSDPTAAAAVGRVKKARGY